MIIVVTREVRCCFCDPGCFLLARGLHVTKNLNEPGCFLENRMKRKSTSLLTLKSSG